MAVLILIRHGNTFEKDQTPVRVGARTNLPLTQQGREQASAMADFLVARYAPLGTVMTAPLARTRQFADILAAKVGLIPAIDERLTEIDYGLWEGKADEEIKALYGAEGLEKWEDEGLWPQGAGWGSSREEVEENVRLFLAEQHDKLMTPWATPTVAVTSNGILRFFYRALTGRKAGASAKVKTGHGCILIPTTDGWTVEKWNLAP